MQSPNQMIGLSTFAMVKKAWGPWLVRSHRKIDPWAR